MKTTINSLQNLCLEEIVSNFSRHFRQYYVAEDSCLKLKYEFLKKRFSFHILQKLEKENCLKPEYLPFLINKYLKIFNTQWLKDWSLDTISQKLIKIGHNLEEAIFTGFGIPWEIILCYLPNLKSVSFKLFCTDEFLLSLSKFCKCVEILDVTNSTRVSDYGLMHLCCRDDDENLHSFPAPIKELSIQYTKVGEKGIAYILKNMLSLEKINYRKLPKVLYSIHRCDINGFNKVKPYNLTHLNLLDINHNPDILTNVITVCTLVCPHLKSLYCPILHKHDLDLCSQLQELETLHSYCWKKDPLKLNDLLTLIGKKLTSLKIKNFCVSLSILAQNCPQLNLLEMKSIHLQHDVNDSVPVFYNLKKITIVECLFTNPVTTQAVTCLLSSVPNLYHLCFKKCEFSFPDIRIQILNCCEQLKLNIIDFSISDVEFVLLRDILLTCSTLQTLNLNKCYVKLGYGPMHELETIAASLPNKPQICFYDTYDDGFDVGLDDDLQYGYLNHVNPFDMFFDGIFETEVIYLYSNDVNLMDDS